MPLSTCRRWGWGCETDVGGRGKENGRLVARREGELLRATYIMGSADPQHVGRHRKACKQDVRFTHGMQERDHYFFHEKLGLVLEKVAQYFQVPISGCKVQRGNLQARPVTGQRMSMRMA